MRELNDSFSVPQLLHMEVDLQPRSFNSKTLYPAPSDQRQHGCLVVYSSMGF